MRCNREKHQGQPTPARARTLGIFIVLVVSANAASGQQVAFTQAPREAALTAGRELENTLLASWYRAGMRVVVADLADIAGTMCLISEGFWSAADPVFSFDGTRLAFAGQRKRGEPLGLWEVSLDRAVSDARKIAARDADCIQPTYLPDGSLVFASLEGREYERDGRCFSFSLFSYDIGTRRTERLTFNPSSDFHPGVLPDGRIAYSSWQHAGNHHWPCGIVALMLINADGTGVFPLTGNHQGSWLKHGTTSLGGGRFAFVQADRSDDFGAGELIISGLNDTFAPYRTPASFSGFRVAGVAALPDGRRLVSARSNADGSSFGLYVQGEKSVDPWFDQPQWHELQPRVGAAARPPERRLSTVVPGTAHGYLLILNGRESDRDVRQSLSGCTQIRVIEGRPLNRCTQTAPSPLNQANRKDECVSVVNGAFGYRPARILGNVPLAADGSAYLKVPADRPLRTQLLDRDGFAVVNERTWFWVRPNERRVCIGCHENRELSPANRTPLASKRPPVDLTNPAAWRSLTFRRDIHPILLRNCAVSDCHAPPAPTGGLNLALEGPCASGDPSWSAHFGSAYADLLARQANKPLSVGGRRVHPGDARRSPLMWMLYGRELAPQYEPAPFDTPIAAPHPGPDELLPEEIKRIAEWIDLGAPYDGPPNSPHELSRYDNQAETRRDAE